MLRISGGALRGGYVRTVKGKRMRFTSSKVRLAMFSMIGDKIKRSKFLELFCGSGIVSIEALSRGAEFATLVDISKRAIKCAMKNFEDLGLIEKAEFLNMGFRRAISYLDQSSGSYDILFADPPYERGYCETLLLDLSEHMSLLSREALIILECHKKERFRIPDGFTIQKIKNFGDTILLILKD